MTKKVLRLSLEVSRLTNHFTTQNSTETTYWLLLICSSKLKSAFTNVIHVVHPVTMNFDL